MNEQPLQGLRYQPMLWFEPDAHKEAAQILREGMSYYAAKYGQQPTQARVCLSWPEMNGDLPEGLRLERARYILPRNVLLSADLPPSGETP
jgi:hypothetical protein